MGTVTRKRVTIDRFIPVSTDPAKIRFFGTLMPALLLLKASPFRFVGNLVAQRWTPQTTLEAFVAGEADDVARVGDTLVFVHAWQEDEFDPFAFARAKTFLSRAARLAQREGYSSAERLDPLSPSVNLPRLAAQAGLGDLSPYGLLVHPAFGPRLVLTGLRTNHPLSVVSRWQGRGCTDCLACVHRCPQSPLESGTVDLGQCHGCAICLAVCPVGRKESFH